MKEVPKPLKTRQEIAEELKISPKTLYRRIKDNNIEITRNVYLSHAEQNLIYQLFEVDNEEQLGS